MANITKRKDSFLIRVSCGYDAKGKQIIKSKTWTPTEGMTERQIAKELERQKVLFEEQVSNGECISGKITFSEFAEQWFKDYAEKQLKPKTIFRYQSFLERVNSAIGNIRLDRLQPHHLMAFYNTLSAPGARQDTTYKAKPEITAILKEKGLTRDILHNDTGLGKGTITNVKKGVNVAHSTAAAIAKALDMKIKDLFIPNDKESSLDPQTVLHYHRFISSVLSTAVYWQVITSNPCQRVKPPKVEHKEAKYLDEEGAEKLLKALEDEPLQYRVIIYTLLYTGLRRGEVCGLEWKDIDFKNQTLRVNRTSGYVPGKGVYEDTAKNDTSIRKISIAGGAANILREYKTMQGAERLRLGSLWQDYDRIFTQWNGKPIHPDTVSRWFRTFVKRNGLPPVSIHSLRHTHATLLIANHADIRTVSGRLGHARTSTTLNIYSHVIRSADEAAAQTIDNILRVKKA
ncbi:MAG: tyrosine-type recombinase/integrase [Clostridiales bacterium]